MSMTHEEIMNSPGSSCYKDSYVILDVYDFARILTQELRERKFLYPDEYIHPLDIADLFSSMGYYLTVKRKNGKTNIFWSAK